MTVHERTVEVEPKRITGKDGRTYKVRHKAGKSIRTIAEEVGVSEKQVRKDLDEVTSNKVRTGADRSAGGKVSEPSEKITGKDGKQYKVKPRPVQPVEKASKTAPAKPSEKSAKGASAPVQVEKPSKREMEEMSHMVLEIRDLMIGCGVSKWSKVLKAELTDTWPVVLETALEG